MHEIIIESLFLLFYYLGQGFKFISFLGSISSYTENEWSHLNHTITFADFIWYLICNVMEIPWQGIFLWDLRSITFWNFDQNIKCSGKHWIGQSKYQATKNKWSYHLVCMRNHTYRVSLKEFLKLFKCLASSSIHTVSEWLDLLFKALHQERKRRMKIILTRLS